MKIMNKFWKSIFWIKNLINFKVKKFSSNFLPVLFQLFSKTMKLMNKIAQDLGDMKQRPTKI